MVAHETFRESSESKIPFLFLDFRDGTLDWDLDFGLSISLCMSTASLVWAEFVLVISQPRNVKVSIPTGQYNFIAS